ncbi:unnamed protein product [Nesidiocoris tenuis]|uniref:Uncharacterized protein n=1 Tax=Nesidiocoris tenuis TaxID=355587 RepID=A0A6H5FYX0_9HEMI|nr:unnamed protein product [Nesidiocoris tenuis]
MDEPGLVSALSSDSRKRTASQPNLRQQSAISKYGDCYPNLNFLKQKERPFSPRMTSARRCFFQKMTRPPVLPAEETPKKQQNLRSGSEACLLFMVFGRCDHRNGDAIVKLHPTERLNYNQ